MPLKGIAMGNEKFILKDVEIRDKLGENVITTSKEWRKCETVL